MKYASKIWLEPGAATGGNRSRLSGSNGRDNILGKENNRKNGTKIKCVDGGEPEQ
jgi:hypothetical protein